MYHSNINFVKSSNEYGQNYTKCQNKTTLFLNDKLLLPSSLLFLYFSLLFLFLYYYYYYAPLFRPICSCHQLLGRVIRLNRGKVFNEEKVEVDVIGDDWYIYTFIFRKEKRWKWV